MNVGPAAAERGALAASVIITAHDRPQFLREAVESILAQDLDRSKYEVIVVKNFSESAIDAFLDRQGVRRILCKERSSSRKVAEGLREARGTVVFLLDDDDLFEPNKLGIVLREFESCPTLGFYHNQVSLIGRDGGPLPAGKGKAFALRSAGRARRVALSNEAKNNGLAKLAFSYPDFNSSSLAIRHDLAVESLPFLTRIEGGVDTFFFFAALISPCSLLFDDKRLTRYRIHDENTSLAGAADPRARRARLLAAAHQQDHVNRVTREMVVDSGHASVLRELDARILITQLSIVFRDPQSDRADAARALLRGIGLRGTFAVKENLPSLAGAMLFALSPGLARTTYDHRVSIR